MGKKRKRNLDDLCLHCVFFQAHQDKWPDWKPDGDNKDIRAFNDMVHSASKIVTEIFLMLDPLQQMMFWREVFAQLRRVEGDEHQQPTLADVMEAFKASVTKH